MLYSAWFTLNSLDTVPDDTKALGMIASPVAAKRAIQKTRGRPYVNLKSVSCTFSAGTSHGQTACAANVSERAGAMGTRSKKVSVA